MIIVEIRGGLGNQIFQFAHGLQLANAIGAQLKIDTRRLELIETGVTPRNLALGAFNFSAVHADRSELKVFDLALSLGRYPRLEGITKRLYPKMLGDFLIEKTFSYVDSAPSMAKRTYAQGYWQSEKYFSAISSELRSMLKPKLPLSQETNELLSEISNTNALCVNVRRGDFTNNDGNNFHGLMGADYYTEATRLIQARNDVENVYIFSDDPEWCTHNLRLSPNQKVIDHKYAGPEFSSYLQLMAGCKYFVIPNSTFAWWAVWLSGLKNREVVAPSRWFTDPSIDVSDLIPGEWLRI